MRMEAAPDRAPADKDRVARGQLPKDPGPKDRELKVPADKVPGREAA